jgi:hypothetical protein
MQNGSVKRAYLVLGPESSGTRLMTRLLIAAGCYGDSDHHQRLDTAIPGREPFLAWRRSIPHGGTWPDLERMVEIVAALSYGVTAVIMSRDWHSMAISQEQAPHAESAGAALEQIQMAYRYIFASLPDDMPFEIVNYEAVVMRPRGTIKYLFTRLGLPVPELPYIYDANGRYYQEVERVT